MNDCPNLDSIMARERRIIRLKRESKVKRLYGGRPPFTYKPPINGSGCSLEDGFPTRPEFDIEVRKRAKKRNV